MRRSSVFLLALTALLAPVGAGASPAQERAAAPAVVFRDAAGDGGTAADIATVRVSTTTRAGTPSTSALRRHTPRTGA